MVDLAVADFAVANLAEFVAVNVPCWVVSGALIGWLFARRRWESFVTPGPFTTLRSWESRERYEQILRVRAWKDLMPEAGTWFGGISKRRLPTRAEGGLPRFAAESLRAERVHFTYAATIAGTLLWTRGWWVLVTLGFGFAVNLPCIALARYNRLRLAHLA